jgi:hypothetical protein
MIVKFIEIQIFENYSMVDKTLKDHIYWIPSRQIKQVPLNGSTYSK